MIINVKVKVIQESNYKCLDISHEAGGGLPTKYILGYLSYWLRILKVKIICTNNKARKLTENGHPEFTELEIDIKV